MVLIPAGFSHPRTKLFRQAVGHVVAGALWVIALCGLLLGSGGKCWELAGTTSISLTTSNYG